MAKKKLASKKKPTPEKILVRSNIDPDTYRRLKATAAAKGASISETIEKLLDRSLPRNITVELIKA